MSFFSRGHQRDGAGGASSFSFSLSPRLCPSSSPLQWTDLGWPLGYDFFSRGHFSRVKEEGRRACFFQYLFLMVSTAIAPKQSEESSFLSSLS